MTRSEPGASRLVAALTEANLSVAKTPAIEVADVPGQFEPPINPGAKPDVCIVVSQHAASRYQKSPWFCPDARHIAIGQATLNALDCPAQLPTDPTTEGILELESLQGGDCCIWIVAGIGGREDLTQSLVARGHQVHKLVLYERRAMDLVALVPAHDDLVEVSSVTALDVLGRHFASAHERQAVTLLLPSSRIAEVAESMNFYNRQIANSAEIADVVTAALDHLGNRS